MNLKQIFCLHRYTVVATKRNFYGMVKLFECEKCNKQRVESIGWPELGKPHKTEYKHYDR